MGMVSNNAVRTTRFWRRTPGITSQEVTAAESTIEHILTKFDEAQPPIVVDDVDYTFYRPDLVAKSFAATFERLSHVEYMVQQNVVQVETVFGSTLEPVHAQFLKIWGPQEVAHGLVLDKAAGILGLPQLDLSIGDLGPAILFAKLLVEHLPAARDSLFLAYLVTGGITESAATSVYRLWERRLRSMGEPHFAETGIKAIGRQEPTHYVYYKKSAELMRRRMTPWQIYLARVLKHLGNPLPSADRKHREQFGQATWELTGPDDATYMELALKFHRAHRMLLGYKNQGGSVSSPVLRALRDCRELSLRMMTEQERLIPQLVAASPPTTR